MEGGLEELLPSGSVDSELRAIGGQINFLEGTIGKIVDNFNHVSRITDSIKVTIRDVQRTLKSNYWPWDDAYIDCGHHIKRLTAYRNNIAQNVEQTTTLEVELERFRKRWKSKLISRCKTSCKHLLSFILGKSPSLWGPLLF